MRATWQRFVDWLGFTPAWVSFVASRTAPFALALLAGSALGQEKLNTLPCKVGATCVGTGAVTTTGTLASGQVALGSGATSITGDSGLTRTGTGDTFHLKLGSLADVGLAWVAAATLRLSDGSTGYGDLQLGAVKARTSGSFRFIADAPNNTVSMASDTKLQYSSTTGAQGTPDLALSRASAGTLLVEDGSGNARDVQARSVTASDHIMSVGRLTSNYGNGGLFLYGGAASSIVGWSSALGTLNTPDIALSRPSTGLLLVEDGSGNPRDVQARTGTFGTSLIVGSEAALFNTYKGANSDGLNLFIGGGGQLSIGAVGETYKGSWNTFTGMQSGISNTTGYYNVFSGTYAGYSNTSGVSNTFVGIQAGYLATTGSYNTVVGASAGFANVSGAGNTWIGRTAGNAATGDFNVGLGYSAGRYETGSNAFYVNNVDQADTAGDKAYSLLYGTFAGSAGTRAGNMLRVNGAFETTGTGTFGTSVVTPTVVNGASSVTIGNATAAVNLFGTSVNTAGVIYPVSNNADDIGLIGAGLVYRSGYFGTSVVTPVVSGGANSSGTNTAATTTTVAGQLGTGTGAAGDVVFTVGTPQASGTTQHVAATALTLHNAGTGGTAAPQALFADGSAGSPSLALASFPSSGLYSLGNNVAITQQGGLAWSYSLAGGASGSYSAFFAERGFFFYGGGGSTYEGGFNIPANHEMRLGDRDGASPQPQTLSAQGSRGGTDTNTAGGNLTIRPGAGTGSATGSSIVFQTPTATTSGTTAQTQTTRLTINETGALTASNAVIGGVRNVNTTAASNVNAGETDLITYSVPANTLNVDGRVLRVTAWGTTAANTTSKTVTLYFGATAIATAATTTASLAWKTEGIVVRTGSNAQVVNGLMQWLTVNVGPPGTSSSTSETDSGAITVKCTGTGGASNDITQTGLIVEVLN